jgi:hypothetical protein
VHQGISENVIRKAFSATEEDFLSLVKNLWLSKPQIASAGTCCLVGIICNGLLYVANAGDSRVVLGRAERASREVTAIQISAEHNASIKSVREELQSMHPHDSQIVVLKHNVWRVKGLIQVLFLAFLKTVGSFFVVRQLLMILQAAFFYVRIMIFSSELLSSILMKCGCIWYYPLNASSSI